MDLSVDVGAVHLANPIIAASGTFGYGIEFADLTDLNRLGGIVVKGLSLEPMEGAPAPRLVPTAAGMINAVGLQNVGVRRFISEKLPALRGYRTAIIANVFGRTVEEYAEVVRHLEDAEGLAAYELNISCPNVACGGIQFGSNPAMAAEVVAATRKTSPPATMGETFTECDGHRLDWQGGRGSGGRCLDRCQYVSGNEHRFQDPDVAHRKSHGRIIGTGDQADYAPAGLRSLAGGGNTGDRLGRDRHG